MTRDYFINNVDTWDELVEFCNEIDYDLNVYDEYARDEIVDNQLAERVHDDGWQSIYSWLEDIPSGYDYYRIDDYNDFVGLDDDDFSDCKDDVLEYADECGDAWEEEAEDNEPDIAPYEYDNNDAEFEPAPLSDLFGEQYAKKFVREQTPPKTDWFDGDKTCSESEPELEPEYEYETEEEAYDDDDLFMMIMSA